MIGMVLGVVAVVVVVSLFAALYLWSRRSEHDYEYPTGNQTEEQANAARLGIALNAGNTQLGGH